MRGFGGAQPAQAAPRCTKCNSPPINGQCTSHRWLRCGHWRVEQQQAVFFSLSRNTRTPYTAAEIPTQRCLLYKRVITLAEYNSSRQSVVWSNVNRRGLLDQLNRPISTVYNCAASAAITASGVDPSDSTELFIAVLCRPFVCCCLDSQRRVDVDPRIQNRTTVCPQKQSQLLFTLVACYSSWTLVLTLVFDRRSFPVLRLTCSWRVTTYVGKPPDVG